MEGCFLSVTGISSCAFAISNILNGVEYVQQHYLSNYSICKLIVLRDGLEFSILIIAVDVLLKPIMALYEAAVRLD